MRIAVIDDERPARSELMHQLLTIEPDASITEAGSGAEALEIISKNQFDLLFIDINLGDINGTSLALAVQQIMPKAKIVFATAFSEYAITAFEIGASNYILKPFDACKLKKIVVKCREEMPVPHDAPILNKLPICSNRRVVLVDVKKIIFIETDSRACILHTKDGDFRENLPIGEYEKRLVGHRFFRIHKCFIVNLDEISEILPWHNNSLALRMSGFEQKYLPVGRKNTKELKQALRISG